VRQWLSGLVLVSARVDDERETEAQSILDRHKSVKTRGSQYPGSGWKSFDPNAAVYPAAGRERTRTRPVNLRGAVSPILCIRYEFGTPRQR